MERKEVRSMILSFVLGDGCLHYIKQGGKLFGGLTISHGNTQADYQAWKASLLSTLTDRNIKVRSANKGEAVQISVCMKKFRAWRNFIYKDGKKDVSRILKFITNPTFAVAVWLMDDGYVEYFGQKKENTTWAAFRIYSCETPVDQQIHLIKWFEANFGITPKVKLQKNTKYDTYYPFLKFTCEDSLIIWGKIREFVLQFKSMRYKFRHIETTYQLRMSLAQSSSNTDDIVRHS